MVENLPANAGGTGSIPGQGAMIPHASGPKNQNRKQKQYCNKFNKDFNNTGRAIRPACSTHLWGERKRNMVSAERGWTSAPCRAGRPGVLSSGSGRAAGSERCGAGFRHEDLGKEQAREGRPQARREDVYEMRPLWLCSGR